MEAGKVTGDELYNSKSPIGKMELVIGAHTDFCSLIILHGMTSFGDPKFSKIKGLRGLERC